MKLSFASLGALALAASTNAQYFSDGWAPGQQTTKGTPEAAPTFVAQQQPAKAPSIANIAEFFDIKTLLASAPAVSLFSRFGINITERLAVAVEQAKIWDERVPLITDDNYQDLIVKEPLTEQEEKDRTWIIIMYVQPTQVKLPNICPYRTLAPSVLESRMASRNTWMMSSTRLLMRPNLQEICLTCAGVALTTLTSQQSLRNGLFGSAYLPDLSIKPFLSNFHTEPLISWS
jgi:hypothetical protein